MSMSMIAMNAKEQLLRWDAGDTVWSLSMGGFGPGYEQAIQVLAIEITRDNIDKPLPDPDTSAEWGEETVNRINESCGGFSGAQVGAAKWLAYQWLSIGPAALIMSSVRDKDRKIQVSSFWPRVDSVQREP